MDITIMIIKNLFIAMLVAISAVHSFKEEESKPLVNITEEKVKISGFSIVTDLERPVASNNTEPPEIISKEPKTKRRLEYGNWKSVITSTVATASYTLITEPPKIDPVTGKLFWVQSIEKGKRHAIFHYDPATHEKVQWLNEGDIRSVIHDYGGSAFVVYNNTVFFTSIPHLHVFRQSSPEGFVSTLTKGMNRRYADASYSAQLHKLFWVVEDYNDVVSKKVKEPKSCIVMMDPVTGEEKEMLALTDFYASPRPSQDGSKLAWIQWTHPNMPWDSTTLLVSRIKPQIDPRALEKFIQHGSMMMPMWGPYGELFYVHDISGFWNLYVLRLDGQEVNLTPLDQEVGWPMWWIGHQAFDIHPTKDEVAVICGKKILLVDTKNLNRTVLDIGYDSFINGITYSKDGNKVYVVAGNSYRTPELIEVDLMTTPTKTTIISGNERIIPDSYISVPEKIQFHTGNKELAFGYLYYPKNAEYKGIPGTKPPLLVKVHGGPTDKAHTTLDPTYQFFTSRGWAILDVDYRGSVGYGNQYMQKLYNRWGLADVEDVVNGANAVIDEGIVDGSRVAISGFSAGAFTTISALLLNHTFKAGTSFFGISDLEKLSMKTHKLESRYVERLVGIEDLKKKLKERSPIHNIDNMDNPVLFVSGGKDPVIPAEQSAELYNAVRKLGLPTAHLSFPDGGHGFQHRSNLRTALESEIVFYSRLFGLHTDVESHLYIDNLDRWRKLDQEIKKYYIF